MIYDFKSSPLLHMFSLKKKKLMHSVETPLEKWQHQCVSKAFLGTPLEVQRLRLHVSNARDSGLVLGQGI